MLTQINDLKNILVNAFLEIYLQYQADDIYACCLSLDEFLLVDDLMISTEKSIFNDQEDHLQYLAEHDRWNAQKWRYRSQASSEQSLKEFRTLLAEYFQSQYNFGNPLLNIQNLNQSNHLGLILNRFKAAMDTLEQVHHLNLSQIIFFVYIPKQQDVAIQSAKYLNKDSLLLRQFLFNQTPKNSKTSYVKTKLSQTDKDILADLAQIVEVEPYEDIQVAHATYLLTLEPHFVDVNMYIQKLIQNIAAMAFETNGHCAMSKVEILQRLEQFHYTGQNISTEIPI